jgi:RNA polymerase sigma-70 factor (TIGR02943 family)
MLQPQQWVANYGDYLFSIAVLKTNNKEVAEDLVQDTFLSAIKAMNGFKGESNEKTWLTAILNNKIIDYYRKKDVLKNADSYLIETEQPFYGNFFESETGTWGHWVKAAQPQAWDKHADQALTNADFYKILELCMSKIPTKLTPIFLAKFIDEEDSEKICKDFDISSSNYWVIIHRTKMVMRKCLETNWFKK